MRTRFIMHDKGFVAWSQLDTEVVIVVSEGQDFGRGPGRGGGLVKEPGPYSNSSYDGGASQRHGHEESNEQSGAGPDGSRPQSPQTAAPGPPTDGHAGAGPGSRR
ncbi:hypothetical protein GCM10009574_099600 [Streptomyces asiaticus]|uniref:Uncharacterized protein n=2 Tax=Streptomyces rhizosphaericus TaxID=114699 RepID=A0ABN1RR91_9ACTN